MRRAAAWAETARRPGVVAADDDVDVETRRTTGIRRGAPAVVVAVPPVLIVAAKARMVLKK
jgi:hypothetical protein